MVMAKGIEKDVKIEIKDGVKKITQTTTKNRDKSVKVYEGEQAENIPERK